MSIVFFHRVGLLLCMSFLSACVPLLDATTDKPLQVDPGKRSFGQYVDDNQLETIIAVNIRKASPALETARIDVHSYNSVVLLTGEVPTVELRELAGETARNVNRVRQVYNELALGEPARFLSRSNDNWIHSKIKTKLMFNSEIDSSRVQIIVENNVVFLMGMLTRVQAEKITEVVRTTRGVSKVVRAIEYID